MMPPWLDSVRRRLAHLHWPTLIIALVLYLIGVAAVFEAEIFEERGFRATSAFRQLIWGGLAAGVCLALMIPHYRRFERIAYWLFGLGLVLLVAVALVGVVKNNARRWIDLRFMLLQPSEPMKLALILAVSRALSLVHLERTRSFALALALTAAPFLLIVRQPDLGTSLLLLPVVGTLVFLAGLSWRVILALLLVGLISAPVAYVYGLAPYQRKRITSFIDPTADPSGDNYQLTRSLTAIGAGQAGGVEDRDQLYFVLSRLPERQTDFVFAVVGARWGFAGTAAVVVLFACLVLSLIDISFRCREPFGRLVAAGVAVMIGIQAMLNIAMSIGLAPITGVPLPLVSYGGSSLLTTAAALGLALNVSMRPVRPMTGTDSA